MAELNGKVAIITGGAKGIGEAIAKRFLADGAAGVALLDYDAETVAATAKALDATGKKVLAVNCDVSKQEQVEAAVQKTVEAFGTVDILINNAGITRDAMFHKMSREKWDQVLDINLNGTFMMTQQVLPIMREKAYGRIVNISSVSAFGLTAGQANYAASKAALIGLTKSLARENASKNIVVNCIAPGFIDTDMYQAVPQKMLEKYMEMIPMGRLGGTDEVAGITSFLSSDDVSYMSGQVLIVSGAANT